MSRLFFILCIFLFCVNIFANNNEFINLNGIELPKIEQDADTSNEQDLTAKVEEAASSAEVPTKQDQQQNQNQNTSIPNDTVQFDRHAFFGDHFDDSTGEFGDDNEQQISDKNYSGYWKLDENGELVVQPDYFSQYDVIMDRWGIFGSFESDLINNINAMFYDFLINNQIASTTATQQASTTPITSSNQKIDPELEEFVTQEMNIMLHDNKNYDVVLGELTQQAYFELLSSQEYIRKFWAHYISPEDLQKAIAIRHFIERYDSFKTH